VLTRLVKESSILRYNPHDWTSFSGEYSSKDVRPHRLAYKALLSKSRGVVLNLHHERRKSSNCNMRPAQSRLPKIGIQLGKTILIHCRRSHDLVIYHLFLSSFLSSSLLPPSSSWKGHPAELVHSTSSLDPS